MPRPIANRVVIPLPAQLIARAKRVAVAWHVSLNEFLRSCIEGQVNQIEASKRRRPSSAEI